MPSAAYALTGGPGQPEFSSFEPVGSNKMVDEFSGDFTYNIPLINVPGPQGSSYPLSLSYHSGAGMEEEASWVGYGWTLNAGAINRTTRGFPDDYAGEKVTYHNKMPKNWTATVGISGGGEVFGSDKPFMPNGSASLRYNNYSGFGFNAGIGISLGKGLVNLGINTSSDGEASFSASINPIQIFSRMASKENNNSSTAEAEKDNNKKNKGSFKGGNVGLTGGGGIFSYSEAVRPQQVSKYSGQSYNVTIGLEGNILPLPAGVTFNTHGSYSFQETDAIDDLDAFGYMYSAHASGDDAMMDYYTEKGAPYSKRDNFIGIPFNNADNFVVTGEGIGGGFKLFHKQIGEFSPNRKKSETAIFNAGGEINVGLAWGGGWDAGVGYQTLEEGPWTNTFQFSDPDQETVDEPVFFRFNNDIGGNWLPQAERDDAPVSAVLDQKSGIPGSKKFDLFIPNAEVQYNSLRSQRSSYIGYRTRGELDKNYFQSYQSKVIKDALAGTSNVKAIAEMSVTNASGNRYIYGLPVLSKNEKNLQFGLQGTNGNDIINNYLVYSGKEYAKIGEERNASYSTAFLLTEINTPDYVDRKTDGPTADDYGGFTQFVYHKDYGGSGSWYKWRIPYEGLLYQRNSLSDGQDDMGSVSEGEKEIYYLQAIRTKTHTAIFVLKDRTDGKDANSDSYAAKANPNAPGGSNTLKYLDRIDLYANDDVEPIPGSGQYPKYQSKNNAKAIKSVRFKYKGSNVSLCKDLPNAGGGGKLTLEQVWFEYNEIEEAKISPYVFDYAYPVNPDYPSIYADDVKKFYADFVGNQNPNYYFFNLDAWGNYQLKGADRYRNMKTWLDQTPDLRVFDPAAWQLKVIKLPSGGEIHVQYEQDDYAYVQDQPAHVMINLANTPAPTPGYPGDPNKFYLETDSIGINTVADKRQLADLIKKEYVNSQKKLYFKFLYNLYGNVTPDINDCNVEYITGYVKVKNVEYDTNTGKVFVVIGEDNEKYTLPHEVCVDFVKKQRQGKVTSTGNCDPSVTGISDDGDPVQVVKKLGNFLVHSSSLIAAFSCKKLNTNLSYFKIPFNGNKKGGGLRVKRLLTFDNGPTGEKVLYGNEYIYQFSDPHLSGKIRSSGVATNEPGSIREENALVQFMPRKSQTKISKIISGTDKKQSEGPIGESVYPGPSVGYSKVIIKNIHSGKTNPGFSVKEFYTAKEYPVKVETTTLVPKMDPFMVPGGYYNVYVNNIWMTQGFSIILNNMHGQIKRDATYSGDPNNLTNAVVVSGQEFEYFEPSATVPMISEQNGTIEPFKPGKETDITMAHRAVKDHLVDANVEQDLSASFLGGFIPIPIIFPTVVASVTRNTSEIYTHATSKVVRYPAILKKIVAYQNGIKHTTEYTAFDKYTAQPVVTKSYDEFKGGYLKDDVRASWVYENMRSKSLDEGKVIATNPANNSLRISQGSSQKYLQLETLGTSCPLMRNFKNGDVLLIRYDDGSGAKEFICNAKPEIHKNILKIYDFLPTSLQPPIIIPPNGFGVASIKILQSGYTNQLDAVASTTTYHNNDLNALSVPRFEKGVYGSDAFITAINSNINQSSFILSAEYTNVNVTAYASKIPANLNCRSSLSAARIKNVRFTKELTAANGYILGMRSFEVLCGGQWVKVQIN